MFYFRNIFFLLLCFPAFSQEELSLLYVGDVMQHGPQITAARNEVTDSYDYDACFQYVKPIIEKHDLAIANLEVTHAGKPYSGYPQFSAPDELSKALVTAGFDIILTSNNHSCDGGSKGVVRTLDVLDKLGVRHTGTFRNKAERDKNYPLMVEQNGMKVAVLNYTYGTNGLSVAAPLIINYIDSTVLKTDINKAKKLGAEYIICTVHWGSEYESLPSAYQKKWEKYIYELGADMIIGSHPHVIQPIEKKVINSKEKLTAYSLGNYISNQRDRYKNGGAMVFTTLQKEEGKISLKEVNHCFAYVHIKQEKALKYYYILPEFDYNSSRKDFLLSEDLSKMNEFFADSRKLFQDHSKGSSEFKVSSDSLIVEKYNFLLKGYYSVQIENKKDTITPVYMNSEFATYAHKVVNSNGTYAYVSGFFKDYDQALGNKRFVEDCGIKGDMKIVFITQDELKVIEQ